jgi:hypothetical protein
LFLKSLLNHTIYVARDLASRTIYPRTCVDGRLLPFYGSLRKHLTRTYL